MAEAEPRKTEADRLKELADRVGGSTDRLVNVGNDLRDAINTGSAVQSRHQKTLIGLTVVIALATIAYVWMTWLSVQTMQEANRISQEQVVPVDTTGGE